MQRHPCCDSLHVVCRQDGWRADGVEKRAGVGHRDVPELERLGEGAPVGVGEADRAVYRGVCDGWRVLDGRSHSIKLSGQAIEQLGAVATIDVKAPVWTEEAADVATFDFARVALGIDNPDPRRPDDDVVDVGAGAGECAGR